MYGDTVHTVHLMMRAARSGWSAARIFAACFFLIVKNDLFDITVREVGKDPGCARRIHRFQDLGHGRTLYTLRAVRCSEDHPGAVHDRTELFRQRGGTHTLFCKRACQ